MTKILLWAITRALSPNLKSIQEYIDCKWPKIAFNFFRNDKNHLVRFYNRQTYFDFNIFNWQNYAYTPISSMVNAINEHILTYQCTKITIKVMKTNEFYILMNSQNELKFKISSELIMQHVIICLFIIKREY